MLLEQFPGRTFNHCYYFPPKEKTMVIVNCQVKIKKKKKNTFRIQPLKYKVLHVF